MTRPGRSSREQTEFERFHYPGTQVLRNKLGLHDAGELELAERYLSSRRAHQGFPDAAVSPDVAGLQAIHHHLFQDIYDWAGSFRTYTTGRGTAPFAPPEQIRPWLEKQFAALTIEGCLKGLSADRFAERAAFYVNEINAAHPFIEGNGRAQRVWFRNLAAQAGHEVRLRSEDRERWYEASRIGFENADHAPMEKLIRECIVTGKNIERLDD
jgi:fido (protein-threonine AMPylation protein)